MKVLLLFLILISQVTFSQNVKNYDYNDNHIKTSFNIKEYCISPNNDYIAVYSNTGIYIVDTNNSLVVRKIDNQKLGTGVSRMLFSNNSNKLYVSVFGDGLRIYPINGYSYTKVKSKDLKSFITFDISNDGRFISLLGLKEHKSNKKTWKGLGTVLLAGAAIAVIASDKKNKQTTTNRYQPPRNRNSYYNRNRKKTQIEKKTPKSTFTYALNFINTNDINNGYMYEVKNLKYNTGDIERNIYQYLILSDNKKEVQVINPKGNTVLIRSSSSKGLISKVNKKPIFYDRSMSDNLGFNNPKAHYTYKKLGLYKELYEFGKDKIVSSESNIIGPKYRLVNRVLKSLSWNDVPKENNSNEISLYTDDNNQNSKTNDFSFKNIDINIPTNFGNSNPKKYALIIGNENYNSFSNPEFVINDARMFKKYSEKILGIPSNNIFYLEDGTSTNIKNQFIKIKKVLRLENGDAEFYFYYAGHIEVDKKKNKCLVSIDAPDNELKYEIKFNEFLNDLFKIKTKRNYIFLDACFAGSARNLNNENNEYIASRGHIVRKYKRDVLRGNTVLFASSKDFQKSYSDKKLKHGIFTYNLLLKLKETNGSLTLLELKTFLEKNVEMTSLKLNSTNQTPTLDYNPKLGSSWENWIINN